MGGSSRRTVTGRGDMTVKMSLKSPRWMGSSLSRAAWRSSGVSATIISTTMGSRSVALNMRSVRHRPMPMAPYFRARAASLGVSALARTCRRATPSAQPSRVTSSWVNSASMAGTSPR